MLNMDFSKKRVIETEPLDWVASPAKGVWRMPLEREEKESGHTTSVVRYQPESSFSEHPHPKGEEIFVLDGVFSDEKGDYPAGTYIRNPPGSAHSPSSKNGCTILVKLNQLNARDSAQVRINTLDTQWLPGIGGLQVMPLHEFEHEHVALVKWPAGERFQPHRHFGGEEIFVLSGTFRDEHGTYPTHTWIRSPHMSEHFPFVEEETIILVKTGHLPID
ncbi:cupin domain-containing protein [uncultured Vibrio sp.]|uniref:cupin domain-containing protein n=1 Tax=uncultured Vibrio sp. TaxID=114054 RepID=UPI0025EBEC36|nr:cupin domain-containing protein [uncultured Vibrio sp.]